MLLAWVCRSIGLSRFSGYCSELCCCAAPGEGLYQVLETVESGLLASDDDAVGDGDASQQKPVTADPGTCDSYGCIVMTLSDIVQCYI